MGLLRTAFICTSIALMLSYSPNVSAAAQDSDVICAPNAALAYWRIFAIMEDPRDEKLGDILYDVAYGKKPYDHVLDAVVHTNEEALQLLRRDSLIPLCDFQLNYGDGYDGLLLPHLHKARALARLAIIEAKFREEQGRWSDATADYLAVMRLAMHLMHDEIVISLLLNQTIMENDCAAMRSCLVRLPTGEAALRQMSKALAAVPSDYPDYTGALRNEQRFFRDYVKDIGTRVTAEEVANSLDGPKPDVSPEKVMSAFSGKLPADELSKLAAALRVAPADLASLERYRQALAAGLDKNDDCLRRMADLLKKPFVPAMNEIADVAKEAGTLCREMPATGLVTMKVAEQRARLCRAVQATYLVSLLRLYKDAHDQYPAQLADLETKAPQDPYTGEPFGYERTEQGFRLLSVEKDGKTPLVICDVPPKP